MLGPGTGPTVREPADAWTALLAGTLCVALGAMARETVDRRDRRLFAALNRDATDRPLLLIPQQLGTPWVLPALAVVGSLTHRPHLGVAGAVALPLEKSAEGLIKMGFPRPRPAKVDSGVELRDDAPTDGPSYPSGHAARVFTAVFLVAPHLPVPVIALSSAMAAATSWVRVRQGAHFPVDALGGALLGITVASTLNATIGRPAGAGLLRFFTSASVERSMGAGRS